MEKQLNVYKKQISIRIFFVAFRFNWHDDRPFSRVIL